jgi:AcrR family transcriptional regulator
MTSHAAPNADPAGGRARIFDAALGVFADRGYDAASIAEIGQRAGVAKSVMYHHFGSKAGLYEAVVKAQNADLIDQITAALPTDPAAPRLRAGIDAYFAFLEARPTVWQLLFRDPPVDPELVKMHQRLQRERADLLASLLSPPGQKARGRRAGKQLFTELLTTGIRAYAAWWYDHPRVPRRRVVDTVMDFAQAGAKGLAR